MRKIVHLTSAHRRYDTRIFLKQSRSLARAGYRVILVVADGHGDENNEGVEIVDAGRSRSRLWRMIGATRRVLAAAQKTDANLYHIHDPELIPAGLALRRAGERVVFDAHEDLPKQLLGKSYLHPLIRRLLAGCLSIYERRAYSRLSGIIAATPFIRDKFLKINPRTMDVNNFPMLGELGSGEIDWSTKRAQVAYVGAISRIRGILEVVQAMGQVESAVRLQLGGRFSEEDDFLAAREKHGWSRVDYLGYIDRSRVRAVLKDAVAGLVVHHPVVNYVDGLPTKMFEYMSAGLPVIASNFPLLRDIIEGNRCGLCVDPLNPQAIADAIDYMVTHPAEAEDMGRNGKRAVQDKYNWEIEEQKLLRFYEKLISSVP